MRNQIEEISSIQDIQSLLISCPNQDWKQWGEVSTDTKEDLTIFNYTAKAQYDARWNFFERVCRGLILNNLTGEIVARPFDRFFNWLEGGRKASGHIVSVTEKLDGSLGIGYRKDGFRISTRGAFESEQALWANDFLKRYDLTTFPEELTPLFEIIYPENRIVVDYMGREDLVLLAARNRFTGDHLPLFPDVYNLATQYKFHLPNIFLFNNIGEIIVQTGVIDASQEGWVVEFSDGTRWKLKGDRYIELHKLISSLSFKRILEHIMNGSLDSFKKELPEEFIPQVEEWENEINKTAEEKVREVDLAFQSAPKSSRKEFAIWVMKNNKELSSYLFKRFDNCTTSDILRSIYEIELMKKRNLT